MDISAKQIQFGPLVLAFTDRFDLRWEDRGSGGTYDGAFWQPKPPSGFFALGSIGVANYDDQNGRNWALCVKAVDSTALAAPTGYDKIWVDKKSGSKQNGSCWRPRAPHGYTVLGDVFVREYQPPGVNDVRCVRNDLVVFGKIGSLIWNDRKTGSATDFSAWQIGPPVPYVDETRGAFAPNTFYGTPSHNEPRVMVSVLALPFPVQRGVPPVPPKLTSREEPPRQTTPQVDRTVTVPFTAIYDPGVTMKWQIDNSPFYTVERSVYYRLEIFNNNQTPQSQTMGLDVQVGVSRETSQSWEVKTGISVTTEAGVDFVVSASVSATISVELGFSSSTSVTVMQSRTLKASLITSPNTSAALWDISYAMTVKRADGTAISHNLDFAANGSFLESEFPMDAEGREFEEVHFPTAA